MANAWILRPEPIASASATFTASGLPIHVANDYAGIAWQSPPASYINFFVDLGDDRAVDSIVLLGLDGGWPAGTYIKVHLATEAQGGAFSSSANYWAGSTMPIDDGSLPPVSGGQRRIWTAPAVGGPPSAVRHVLVQFVFPGDGWVRMSRLVIGKRIVLERNYSFGGEFGVRDFGAVDFSARAVLLRRRGTKLRTVSIKFANAYRDEVEGQVLPLLEQIGSTEPVALVTDPAPHAMRQRRIYFGPLLSEQKVAQRTVDGWEWPLTMVSLL